MRFENVTLEGLDTNLGNGEWDGNYCIPCTDELIEITNIMRKREGNEDLVGIEFDNNVYYNHYLYFNADRKEITLESICNHGEKDDYVSYNIELFPEEKEMLMWKVIKQLLIYID